MSATTPVDPVTKFQKPAVQCFHGGQSFRSCKNFKCDFSVTTNLAGPPESAVAAARSAFADIEHYPDQEAWEVRCHLAEIMKITPAEVLVGNGASEFIDIVPRLFPRGTEWRPGPWPAQFMEYERAADNAGLIKTPWSNSNAPVTIMINPNSPTGDYIPFDKLREMIARDSKSTFVIDESFISCCGPDWMDHSAIRLTEEFGDRVIVIASWTKVFACPLLRLGTVTSTKNVIDKIVKLQVPWSVNGFAQKFMVAALHDEKYLHAMWEKTPIWKQQMYDLVKEIGFKPNLDSPMWVPFVYVDMLTAEIAAEADRTAFEAGFPIRLCASFGQPEHVRLGVRLPQYAKELQEAWKQNSKLMQMIKDYYAQNKE